MKKIFLTICLVLLSISCTKVMTYAVEQHTDTVSKTYARDPIFTFEYAQEVLKNMGYALTEVNMVNSHITTGWKPVRSDSHYMELFNRKDFAASSGAYYQLSIDVTPAANGSRVAISTVIKSVAGNLKSTHVVENKVFDSLDHTFRSEQIEVTNVGMKEK